MESLIAVKQLPVIEERLRTLKDRWEQRAADAEAMVCTEDTIQVVKAFRADMRKEFEWVESQRKEVKNAVMGPYEQFEEVYKDCVTYPFQKADKLLAGTICVVENDMKRRCEDGLREYFTELCAVYHLDWLKYEQAGIKVDMASARSKTPKKLREQIERFVIGVDNGVGFFRGDEHEAEILVEYKRTLDVVSAVNTVKERHQRIEEERAAQESRKALSEREAEAVRRVEALAPPVFVEPEHVFECTFTVHATKPQLRKLKEFLNMEGIRYE